MPNDVTTPTTAAGRALEEYRPEGFTEQEWADDILAIEAEARAAYTEGVFRTDDEMEVAQELQRATDKFGPMASPHEALAVIEEEFIELRESIFWRCSNPRTEAVQLAAMVLRYLRDCNPGAVR